MRRRKYLFLFIIITLILGTSFTYGDEFFYSIKTSVYKNKASEINIIIDKNEDMDNLNINFINEGSCDVFIRGFVFVYFISEENNMSTILSNNSIKVNYSTTNEGSEDNLWYMGEDSYLYYMKPLKVGNRTEMPLVDSIELNLNDEEKELLKNMQVSVDIVVEAVQVDNLAYKYEWEVKDDVLEKYFDNGSADVFNDENNKYEKNDKVKIIIN
ncbi:hypothetical protein [Terrisporobacter sp.]|uniref:hypothetical protein n=1 Tax=Terrisporobacter sp. TaxID=1965305 RepID=UPI0026299213|nr:hypothetical protein [Terrisporobacter sp.]